MSHFVVLVIGDDPEEQLRPYHEFECTGEDDEFIQNVDQLAAGVEDHSKHGKADDLAKFLADWYGSPVIGQNEDPDLEHEHKYGWIRINDEGEVTECIRRTNPNARWDWYQIGGRWRGFFQAKNGVKANIGHAGAFDNEPTFNADQIHKGDIDFDGMRAVASANAELTYARYEEAVAGTPEPETWEATRERFGDDMSGARQAYHAQPRIKALQAADLMPWDEEPLEVYGEGREAFVQRAVDAVASPFALLRDGIWFEKGKMGWFGMSRDTFTRAEWNREIAKLYDELPDDTLLTVVDCHI